MTSPDIAFPALMYSSIFLASPPVSPVVDLFPSSPSSIDAIIVAKLCSIISMICSRLAPVCSISSAIINSAIDGYAFASSSSSCTFENIITPYLKKFTAESFGMCFISSKASSTSKLSTSIIMIAFSPLASRVKFI